MEKEIKTYRHYVGETLYKKTKSSYHEFKSFKIYWSYLWFIAEELDRKGFGVQTASDPTGQKNKIFTNYSEKYIPKYEKITNVNNWKYKISLDRRIINYIKNKWKNKWKNK